MKDEDVIFDDEILMAYADGQVTAGQADAIEAAMESDEIVRRKVLAFVRTTNRLRAAYQPIAEEAAPEHLVAAVRAAAERRGLVHQPPRQAPSRTFWRMAAGFVLAAVIGAGAGVWARVLSTKRRRSPTPTRSAAFTKPLSTVPSKACPTAGRCR